ncbi:SAM-dependent methyltransferase [Amycolatopsis sp. cmx-11-12]|uniref:SAM-dependent methyltransferase n=1 Tax=Amycolatopsis sp. cmx-11-12 TaxID=2785795 RepID=UPI003917467C
MVYADNDPVAVTQSRPLLRDGPATVAIDADPRRPTGILDNATVRSLLDFDQPIGTAHDRRPALHPRPRQPRRLPRLTSARKLLHPVPPQR